MGATAVRDPGNEVDMGDEACVALPKMWATKMKRAENKRKKGWRETTLRVSHVENYCTRVNERKPDNNLH